MATIGREAEREALATVLAAASSGPALLTIEGEPGIGKTAICAHAIASATAAGSMVLSCRPSAAETSLSFSGLTDLLARVPSQSFLQLPAPQRHALAVASLREASGGELLDERAVGTALRSLLVALADAQPLVVLIDDAQWLDDATLEVLAFALRRVGDVPLALVVARRSGDDRGTALSSALTDVRIRRDLVVGGLSAASLFHIVRAQLDLTLARPALVRVAELSKGNPFIALELARSGTRVATSLPSLAADRLAKLSGPAREALLAVACAPRPTLALLEQLGLRSSFDEAEASGTVGIVDGRLAFAHPLLASATLDLAPAAARRDMHARLGAASEDAEAVAHHLALSTPEPDDSVAAALAEAVESAASRGAMAAAVDFARLAFERSGDQSSVAAWERRVRLAELVYLSGDAIEAASLLADLASSCPPGAHRARGWLTMTQVEYQTATSSRAAAAAAAAFADPDGEDEDRLQALLQLAALSRTASERRDRVVMARALMENAVIDNVGLQAWVLCEEVGLRFHAGDGFDRDTIDRALAIERSALISPAEGQAAVVRPVLLKWADEPEEALAGLQELRDRAEAEGNEGLVPYVLSHMPGALIRLGRFVDALAASEEHLYYAEVTGQAGQRLQAVRNLASAHAHLGHLEAATSGAEELLSPTGAHDGTAEADGAAILGFLALSVDEAPTARRWYERHEAALGEHRSVDPGVDRYDGDLIEALIATGAFDEAERRTRSLAVRAERSSRLSAIAVAARCAGIHAAATGEHGAALAHLEAALIVHDRINAPFDAARTLFVKGLVHRRGKEKRAAGEALARARDAFASMGASAWAARAESDLRRVGRRPPQSLDLTETEHRIAMLVAAGLTNRQVAGQAFISPKTVEANLAKVYRKLGISSRAELGARMAAMTDGPPGGVADARG